LDIIGNLRLNGINFTVSGSTVSLVNDANNANENIVAGSITAGGGLTAGSATITNLTITGAALLSGSTNLLTITNAANNAYHNIQAGGYESVSGNIPVDSGNVGIGTTLPGRSPSLTGNVKCPKLPHYLCLIKIWKCVLSLFRMRNCAHHRQRT
jgi:hypothetical protein